MRGRAEAPRWHSKLPIRGERKTHQKEKPVQQFDNGVQALRAADKGEAAV